MGLGSMTQKRRLPELTDEIIYKCYVINITKKLAHGLGDPSEGLHDPPLEIIN